MDYNVLILCGICIFLLIMNIVERVQNSKRENDLLNRLTAEDYGEYTRAKILASKKKPEFIGTVEPSQKPEDLSYPVD